MAEEVSRAREEIRTLVAELADFARRGRAKTRLVMMGKQAVGPLVEALGSPVEGVAWSAAKALGEIGAPEAVGALTQALANPGLKEVAADALRRITGTEPGGAAGAGGESVSFKRLSDGELAKALSSVTVSLGKSGAGYACNVRLPNGRHQKVDMVLGLKDSDGSALVALYTECGPASADKYEWALKTNLKIPFGSFAMRDTSEGPKFVMVDAYLRETASVEQLRRALESLAKRADSLEETLTGADNM